MVTFLNSSTRLDKLKLFILLTLFGVLLYVSQVALAVLPNIEVVTLLIILFTRRFGIRALYSVYVFVFCEILTYGLHIWVINYLYVWAVLVFCILPLRQIDSTLLYTVIAGLFGLLFGVLCSIPYFITGGFAFGISNILAGISFDILHCGGNIISVLILYKPLTKIMNSLKI